METFSTLNLGWGIKSSSPHHNGKIKKLYDRVSTLPLLYHKKLRN